MLLKITENIIRRNVFEQKTNKPGLSANQAFEQLRPVEHLLHVLMYLHAQRTLASVSSNYKHLKEPYDITSLQNLFVMRQFKYRFCCTQSLRSKYAIITIARTIHSSPSTATCRPNNHIERTLLLKLRLLLAYN